MINGENIRRHLARRDGDRCAFCNTDFTLTGAMRTVDHIEPTYKGGTDDKSNLALACRPCNCMKGKQSMDKMSLPYSRELRKLLQVRKDMDAFDAYEYSDSMGWRCGWLVCQEMVRRVRAAQGSETPPAGSPEVLICG